VLCVRVLPWASGRPDAPGTGSLRFGPIRASRRADASAAMLMDVETRATERKRRGEERRAAAKTGEVRTGIW
jgi:hypothetical protein